MNKISCLFLSDDLFIINIFDEYKIEHQKNNDKKIVDIVSMCIKFNKNISIANINLKKVNTPNGPEQNIKQSTTDTLNSNPIINLNSIKIVMK